MRECFSSKRGYPLIALTCFLNGLRTGKVTNKLEQYYYSILWLRLLATTQLASFIAVMA